MSIEQNGASPVEDEIVVSEEMNASIQSVERAARILNFFTVSRPRLTLTEMTARLGMSKATAHRYAMALRQVNLLRYDQVAAEYTLGPQVLVLAAAARAALPIIRLAGPLMEQLVREVNETAVLSIWEGGAPVVVRVDDGTERVIRISVRAGARLAPLGSAQGRVFCAFLPEGSVLGLEDACKENPKLRSTLVKIREDGMAMNLEGTHGVRTVATPVFADNRIAAVVALVGTTATLSNEVNSTAAKALRRTAKRLTELYGKHEVSDLPDEEIAQVIAAPSVRTTPRNGPPTRSSRRK